MKGVEGDIAKSFSGQEITKLFQTSTKESNEAEACEWGARHSDVCRHGLPAFACLHYITTSDYCKLPQQQGRIQDDCNADL